jgi:hypothetical protein
LITPQKEPFTHLPCLKNFSPKTPLQGKHTIAKVFVEVFGVTKLGKYFKKAFATTFIIQSRCFSVDCSGWSI